MLAIKSSAFLDDGAIPTRFTCDGEDTSPPLEWSGVPDQALSLALVVDDPDAPDPAAPKMRFVHWVLYNMPPDARGLPEGAGRAGKLPPGSREGSNEFKKTGSGGPCPPIGRHRYFFTLYALDTSLTLTDSPSRRDLEAAIRDHILEKAEMLGTYEHPH
jgi:Raf kinase inhibitor-like YbhB/YbcL family protein